jgi:c(7)-type cytochrome triheme protein
VKAFPRLRSFNVKFDHAQHSSGAARPNAGCASCHTPIRRSSALSIPAGIPAHTNCYSCHTPGATSGGRNISSCAACHSLGGYSRTPTTTRGYRVGFSHADHGSRQGLRCDQCHNLRAGLPQSRQVTSPVPSQHFASTRAQSCMTCHNNRRTFGGEDFADCKRCHKQPNTFRF